MQIRILQKPVTLERKFAIAINNRKKYSVEGYAYGPFSSYSLFQGTEKRILSIFRQWYSPIPSFNIYFNKEIFEIEKPLKFRTRAFFRNKYLCTYGEELYEIYAHKGLRFSIFKNGDQIAGINQDRWTSFKEDGFRIECDNNSFKELIIAFTILLDHIHNNQIEFLYGLFTLNLGVWWHMQEYNEEWKSN